MKEVTKNLGHFLCKESPSESLKGKFIIYNGDFYYGKRHGLAKLEDMDKICLFHGLFINGSRMHFKMDEDSQGVNEEKKND